MKRTVIAMSLSLAAVHVMANIPNHYCRFSDNSYFGLTVHNFTDGKLLIDLGHPTHGWPDYDKTGGYHGNVDKDRYVAVPAKSTRTGILCSGGLLTGLESYVRLYRMPGYHYMEEWYVRDPFSTLSTTHFTKDTNTCTVQWYIQHAGPPDWSKAVTDGKWRDETTWESTYNAIQQVVAWCH